MLESITVPAFDLEGFLTVLFYIVQPQNDRTRGKAGLGAAESGCYWAFSYSYFICIFHFFTSFFTSFFIFIFISFSNSTKSLVSSLGAKAIGGPHIQSRVSWWQAKSPSGGRFCIMRKEIVTAYEKTSKVMILLFCISCIFLTLHFFLISIGIKFWVIGDKVHFSNVKNHRCCKLHKSSDYI